MVCYNSTIVILNWFIVEAPINEDTFYVDGRVIPNAEGLWGLMQEAIAYRRVFRNSQGTTDWYYQVSETFYIEAYGTR